MSERVILAYSGGLDTSVAISWIGKETGREVVAVAIDLGQGGEDMEVVRKRALDCGAVDRAGEIVRGAGRGAQHGEVAAGIGGRQQLTQKPRHAFGATGNPAHRAAVLGHDVDADAAVRTAQLDRAEFLEIA